MRNDAVEMIRSARNRAPFRRFTIHLKDGRTHTVSHPECLAIVGDHLAILYPNWDWDLFDADSIVSVSIPSAKKPGNSRRGSPDRPGR